MDWVAWWAVPRVPGGWAVMQRWDAHCLGGKKLWPEAEGHCLRWSRISISSMYLWFSDFRGYLKLEGLRSRLVLVSVIVTHIGIYSFPQESKPFLFSLINCLHFNSEHWVGLSSWIVFLLNSQGKLRVWDFCLCILITEKEKDQEHCKLVVIKVALIKDICFKWVNVERQLFLNCIPGRAVLK